MCHCIHHSSSDNGKEGTHHFGYDLASLKGILASLCRSIKAPLGNIGTASQHQKTTKHDSFEKGWGRFEHLPEPANRRDALEMVELSS